MHALVDWAIIPTHVPFHPIAKNISFLAGITMVEAYSPFDSSTKHLATLLFEPEPRPSPSHST
jgi:hypothetical protein